MICKKHLKPANLGQLTTQYNLDENGYGIKDINKAVYWYKKSAKKRDQDAKKID